MADHSITRDVVDGQGPVVIDATLPPTSTYEMLASEGATVLVFSHDATLARVIRNVAADRYPIRIIEAWNDLLQQIGSGKGRIVLLDADAVSADVEDALAEINACSDWLVTIIAAKQQQAQDFMRFWSERRIHRLLIKPAAAGITRLLFESAFARFIELRELHENTDSMEIPQDLVEAERERELNESKKSRRRPARLGLLRAITGLWRPRVVVKLGAVALVAGGLYFGSRYLIDSPQPGSALMPAGGVTAETASLEQPSPAVTVAATDSEPAAGQPFAELLQRARAAEDQGRIARPAGDNALDHYAAILAQAPDHRLARERLDAILEQLFMAAEEQILRGELAAAEATLEDIRRAGPTGSRLRFLSEQLVQVRQADAELVAARRAASTPPPASVPPASAVEALLRERDRACERVLRRLDTGSLIAPSGDSARDYLFEALELGIGEPQLAVFADTFAQQCETAIPRALAAGRIDAARTMLATARRLGAVSPALSALAAEIDAAAAEQARAAAAGMHAAAIASIEAGNFTGGDDSAVESLARLRAADANPALVSDVEARLTNALSRSIREAIAAERWDDGNALIGAFEQAALDLNVVRGLERDLSIARQQAEYLRDAVPVGELTLVDSAPAVYPRSAVRAGITGWVELHFTVDRNGATGDISVVAADPPEQFEQAATAALEQYRFEPFVADGRTWERRARLRMRFEID